MYVIALAVVALSVGPVVYGALGGFRSNEQLARDPAGLPDPWRLGNYTSVFSNSRLLGLRAELDGDRRADHGHRRRAPA